MHLFINDECVLNYLGQEIALSSAVRRLSQTKSFEENKDNDAEDVKFNIIIPKHSVFFLDGCKVLMLSIFIHIYEITVTKLAIYFHVLRYC